MLVSKYKSFKESGNFAKKLELACLSFVELLAHFSQETSLILLYCFAYSEIFSVKFEEIVTSDYWQDFGPLFWREI